MDSIFVLSAIDELIRGSVRESIAEEAGERAKKLSLWDSIKPRLLSPPTFSNDGVPILNLGKTTYITSRRKWKAYKPSVQLANHFGLDVQNLYEKFHFLPGVAALVEKDGHFLFGVRSDNLAGTHTGMVSVPAGLIELGENVYSALARELKEETGLWGAVDKISLGNNPDAPNITFICYVRNPQGGLQSTYETKGRKFVWIPGQYIVPRIFNAESADVPWLSRDFAECFYERGIDVRGQELKLAPDVFEGIKQILRQIYC